MTDSPSAAGALADSHLHLFRRGYHRDQPDGADVLRYEALRETHGIAAGLVVGYQAAGIDPDNNGYLRTLATGREWLTTLAYVPVAPAPDPGQLRRLLDDGHRGIAVYCGDRQAAAAVARWPAHCWRVLAAADALVSVNASVPAHSGLTEVVLGAPGCRFLFSHLGLPGRQLVAPTAAQAAERLRDLLALAPSGHCWVKISGLYAIGDPGTGHSAAEPFVDILIKTFGVTKCLWGSDFSPCLDHGRFEDTLQVPGLGPLSDPERHQVMAGNLMALLGSHHPQP